MDRSWMSAAAAALVGVAIVVAPSAAQAATVDDSCNQVPDARQDLKAVTLDYSATSFFVSTTGCGPGYGPHGSWLVSLHLTSFSPEVVVTGTYQDLGKYVRWSGYHVCAQSDCRAPFPQQGFYDPPGPQVDGPCLYDVYSCPEVTTSGYGAWTDVLPAGTAVPDTISWYAEVKVFDPGTQDVTTLVDRAPESGTATSTRNTSTVATAVTATAGRAPVWSAYGSSRTESGRLTAAGTALAGRLVRVTPVRWFGKRTESGDTGAWTTTYGVTRNTRVRACFRGDGVHDPSCSDDYVATVKAFVSLDLAPSTTVTRGHTLLLKGVVRPRSSGQVRVLVREDRAGTSYRLLRYGNLVQGSNDSYYRISWTPTVAGRYVLRTLWTGGTTAEGGVLSNISDYRIVTVS